MCNRWTVQFQNLKNNVIFIYIHLSETGRSLIYSQFDNYSTYNTNMNQLIFFYNLEFHVFGEYMTIIYHNCLPYRPMACIPVLNKQVPSCQAGYFLYLCIQSHYPRLLHLYIQPFYIGNSFLPLIIFATGVLQYRFHRLVPLLHRSVFIYGIRVHNSILAIYM